MGAAPRGLLLLGVCAVVMAVASTAAAAAGDASSVVVGLAKCADCTRKNLNTETVFTGLKVAIKCKNSNGEYESMAVGELDGSGAFGVPLAADLRGADCLAQLHSAAAGAPCTGQEPSRIVPTAADGTTFVAVAGKAGRPSAECGSATISDPLHETQLSDHFHKDHDHHHHFFDHFHKKQQPPPATPMPEPKPQPTPTYGPPTPICTPPAKH